MVSCYNTLVLPRDWWYTSVKRQDGYIDMFDLATKNKVEIDQFFVEHNILVMPSKNGKAIIYTNKS